MAKRDCFSYGDVLLLFQRIWKFLGNNLSMVPNMWKVYRFLLKAFSIVLLKNCNKYSLVNIFGIGNEIIELENLRTCIEMCMFDLCSDCYGKDEIVFFGTIVFELSWKYFSSLFKYCTEKTIYYRHILSPSAYFTDWLPNNVSFPSFVILWEKQDT